MSGRVQPRSLEQALGVFVEVIQAARRQHGLMFLPPFPARRLHHLRLLGFPQNGLPVRPLFSHAEGWVLLLRELCNTHTLQPAAALIGRTNQGLPFHRA